MGDVTPVPDVAFWGFVGNLLAGLYPLYQDTKIQPSERVDKDRLWFCMNLGFLPLGGLVFAVLARTQCTSIDPIMYTFVGVAFPSQVEKWLGDILSI
jgi:hypothetical protein